MTGRADELKGKVKEVAGKVLGNEQMQGEGMAEGAKGTVQREATGAVDQVTGKVRERAGGLLGDEETQAEGEAQDLKGNAESTG